MFNLLKEAFSKKILGNINDTFNRHIADNNNLASKVRALDNKIIKIKINKFLINFVYYLQIYNGKIILSEQCKDSDTFDLSIELSLGSLIRAKFTSVEQALRQKDIIFHGDIYLAMELQDLINNTEYHLLDEIQAVLEKHTSSAIAWQFTKVIQMVGEALAIRTNNLKEQVSDYLLIESNMIVNKREIADFCDEVDTLRDDVAILSAKIEQYLCYQK